MAMTKNNEGHTYNRFEDEIERFFSNWYSPLAVHSGTRKYPPVNLEVSPQYYDYYLFAAGLDKSKLEVTVDHDLMKISGEKINGIPTSEQVTTFRRERGRGSFTRVINLPKDCDSQQIEANYRSGILHLRVARGGSTTNTKISVK